MAHRDRLIGRDRVIERGSRARQHPAVSQLGKPLLDWLIEAEVATLDQAQRGDRRDHLRHQLDSHDRVGGHGPPAERGDAGCDYLGFLGPTDDRNYAWSRSGDDVPVEQPLKVRTHPCDCATCSGHRSGGRTVRPRTPASGSRQAELGDQTGTADRASGVWSFAELTGAGGVRLVGNADSWVSAAVGRADSELRYSVTVESFLDTKSMTS